MSGILRIKQILSAKKEQKKAPAKKAPAKRKPKTDKELASTRLGKGPAKKTTPTASIVGNIAKAVGAKRNKKESQVAQVKRLAAVKRLKNKKKK